MRTILRPFIALGCSGVFGAMSVATHAQDEIMVEEAPPSFRIEVVVFLNLDETSRSPERWFRELVEPERGLVAENSEGLEREDLPDVLAAVEPPVAPETQQQSPQYGDVLVAPDPLLIESGIEADPDALPLVFGLIADEELQLTRLVETLHGMPSHLPVLHVGWIQPGYPNEFALPFQVEGLGVSAELSGHFKFWMARFLHLEIDLSYQPDSEMPAAVSEDFVGPMRLPLTYRIDEQRRLKRDETHYFDHPFFGVITLITADVMPEESTEIDSDSAG